MKVIIVDDEEHVRRGIDLAVNWEQFGIKERLMADDGFTAIQLIREHKPFLLFCDMSMPGMDGIELLKMLREEGWDTQVIVVSGYNDYPYIRAALLANGVDYIMKPFRTKDLEEAVSRAVQKHQSNDSKSRSEHEHRHRLLLADSLLDEQKLADYLKGEVTYQERTIQNLFHKLRLPLQGLHVACILPHNKKRVIESRFADDSGLFQFAVNNIAQEVLGKFGTHYLCRLDDYQWIIIASCSYESKISEEFRVYLNKLAFAWKTTLGLDVLQEFSATKSTYMGVHGAIAEVRSSLLKRELLQNKINVSRGDMPQFADREIVLLYSIRTGNTSGLTEIVESFIHSLHTRGSVKLEELQVCTMEANLFLKRATSLFQVGSMRGVGLLPLWISDINEWKTELLHRCWEIVEMQHEKQSSLVAMEVVRRYIDQHFNENITLSSLSELFHFSPRYLAKMFKDQFKTTIITYLTDIRMEKAKLLLLHSDMPVAELAESIGYEDENYFGKVFKKQTGLSPLQYRRSIRNQGEPNNPL